MVCSQYINAQKIKERRIREIQMRIGKEITIADWTWKIKFVHSLMVDGQELHGDTDKDNQIIHLNADDNEANTKRSFFHELNHIILDTAGYYFEDTLEHDEHLVGILSALWNQAVSQIVEWQKGDV